MQPEQERKKILVVEDEPDMQIFLSTLLTTGGFEPIVAGCCATGIQKARQDKPILIIFDVMMGGKAGAQMYRTLKHDENLKGVPLIMLSTIDEKTFSFFQKTHAAESDPAVSAPEAYLEKPPEAEELLHLVRRLAKTGEFSGAKRG
ncbi:response regulator [Thermodesulfobacteriota bacterium]